MNIYWKRCSYDNLCRAFHQEFNSKPNAKIEGAHAAFSTRTKANQDVGVIWLNAEKAKTHHIIHECFHAAHWILNDRGLWLTDSSEEAYAYLQMWLYQQIRKR